MVGFENLQDLVVCFATRVSAFDVEHRFHIWIDCVGPVEDKDSPMDLSCKLRFEADASYQLKRVTEPLLQFSIVLQSDI